METGLRSQFPPSTETFFRYCPHVPTLRQLRFILLRDKEAFFGGSAGGGKSDALLMAALWYVHVPDYNAMIFRRTFMDLSLPEALITRSKEWLLATDAHWNDTLHRWTFPSGATIGFGHLDHENAKYQFQSAAFQFIGFDEVTQFLENTYLYLFSRLRRLRNGYDVPLRMRCAANPDGIGFEWVKRRFVNPGDPSRPYIPSKLEDNPHLDQESYDQSLQELDPTTRKRLRDGDWEVRPEGNKFKRKWFEIVDIVPGAGKLVRYWDLAATEAKAGIDPDWTVGTLVLITTDKIIYIIDVKRFRETAGTTEKLIKMQAKIDGKEYGNRVVVRMEQEPGASGKIVIAHYQKALIGFPFSGDHITGNKDVRATPLASYCEAGQVKLVNGRWIDPWLDELTIFPDGEHDDQVDSASGAFNFLAGPMPSTAELLAQAARQGQRIRS